MKLTAGTPIKLPSAEKPLDFERAAEFCEGQAEAAAESIRRCPLCNLVGGQCGCKNSRLEVPCPLCDWTGYVQEETGVRRCRAKRCVEVLKARIAKGQREKVGTNSLNEKED